LTGSRPLSTRIELSEYSGTAAAEAADETKGGLDAMVWMPQVVDILWPL